MSCMIVKLGGSTFGTDEMAQWLDALAASPEPLVIVPGGGVFADQVRTSQALMGFSDQAAHAMAILGMEQFGHVLLDQHPEFAKVATLDEIAAACSAGRKAVWMPSLMTMDAADIACSWDITSDSLSAWLAAQLGAKSLLLIKQSDAFDAQDDVAALIEANILDIAFGEMLAPFTELHIAGPRHIATAAAHLLRGDSPGELISQRPADIAQAGNP